MHGFEGDDNIKVYCANTMHPNRRNISTRSLGKTGEWRYDAGDSKEYIYKNKNK
jgi:hypothetical protein